MLPEVPLHLPHPKDPLCQLGIPQARVPVTNAHVEKMMAVLAHPQQNSEAATAVLAKHLARPTAVSDLKI